MESDPITDPPTEQVDSGEQPMEVEPEGSSISGNVNQELAEVIRSMGFSNAVAEKSLFLTGNSSVEAALNWIDENQSEPDFQEELRIVGQQAGEETKRYTSEEAKERALALQKELTAKRKETEKQDALEAEKERIRSTKELLKAQEEKEEFKRKQAIQRQMEEKKKDEQDLKTIKEQLRRDKEARFGKSFASQDVEAPEQTNTKTPDERMNHAIRTIREVYTPVRFPGVAQTALNTLRTLVNNVVTHPEEEKYRTIKTTNKALQERIVKVTGSILFLKAIGFKPDGEELSVTNPSIELFTLAVSKLETALAALG